MIALPDDLQSENWEKRRDDARWFYFAMLFMWCGLAAWFIAMFWWARNPLSYAIVGSMLLMNLFAVRGSRREWLGWCELTRERDALQHQCAELDQQCKTLLQDLTLLREIQDGPDPSC